jgi:hypothetical protein
MCDASNKGLRTETFQNLLITQKMRAKYARCIGVKGGLFVAQYRSLRETGNVLMMNEVRKHLQEVPSLRRAMRQPRGKDSLAISVRGKHRALGRTSGIYWECREADHAQGNTAASTATALSQ